MNLLCTIIVFIDMDLKPGVGPPPVIPWGPYPVTGDGDGGLSIKNPRGQNRALL